MSQMVVDSSTLILLAKCSLLQTFCSLFDVVVPESVYAEVASEDLLKNYPDAALIAELQKKGAINIKRLENDDRLILPLSLHEGEGDALLLALKLGKLFATDDGKAIKAARFLKIPFIVTPKIVAELYKLQKISFRKGHESLKKLGTIGRYSPEIIADALLSLMEQRNGKTDDRTNT